MYPFSPDPVLSQQMKDGLPPLLPHSAPAYKGIILLSSSMTSAYCTQVCSQYFLIKNVGRFFSFPSPLTFSWTDFMDSCWACWQVANLPATHRTNLLSVKLSSYFLYFLIFSSNQPFSLFTFSFPAAANGLFLVEISFAFSSEISVI